jgi:hypothetical protein
MFVQHQSLSHLSFPVQRLEILYRSGNDVQLALPGLTPQRASAFVLKLKDAAKGQIVIGLHLLLSQTNIFYLTDGVQLSIEQADLELDAGIEFTESMGFVLFNTDISQMPASERETYWQSLPICRPQQQGAAADKKEPAKSLADFPVDASGVNKIQTKAPAVTVPVDAQAKRRALKEHLGQFFASL